MGTGRVASLVAAVLLAACGGSSPVVEQDGGSDAGADAGPDAGNGDAGGVYGTFNFEEFRGGTTATYSDSFQTTFIADDLRDAGPDVFSHANVTMTAAQLRVLFPDGGDFSQLDAGNLTFNGTQIAHLQVPSDAGIVSFVIDGQPNMASGGTIKLNTLAGPNGSGLGYNIALTFHGSP